MRHLIVINQLYTISFNPRICKRCDYWDLITTNAAGVSIHASVKDATEDTTYSGIKMLVSIHASVKDATSDSGYIVEVFRFQSTHL